MIGFIRFGWTFHCFERGMFNFKMVWETTSSSVGRHENVQSDPVRIEDLKGGRDDDNPRLRRRYQLGDLSRRESIKILDDDDDEEVSKPL